MGSVELGELDQMAVRALRASGAELDAPPNPIAVAETIVGPVYRMPLVATPGDAALVRVLDSWRIYVHANIPRERQRWAILHEVAEWMLANEGVTDGDIEGYAQALAARLAAPQKFALAVCAQVGPAYEQLALRFGFDQTASALRFGEVTHTPIAVVAPRRCYVRGVPDSWSATEDVVRRIAKTQPPPGFVVEPLTDDPKRVVLRGA